jgi:hypothetical protein
MVGRGVPLEREIKVQLPEERIDVGDSKTKIPSKELKLLTITAN